MRWAPSRTIVVVAVLLSTACGAGDQTSSSLGQHEAERRVVAAARETIARAVGPAARLTALDSEGNPVTTPCSDISEPPPGTPVTSSFSWKIQGADLRAIDRYFVAFRTYLKSEGWSRRYGEPPDNLAYGRQGLTLLLTWAPRTKLFALTGGTGCVKPD